MLRRWRRSPPSSMSLLKGQIAPARNGMEECRVEGVLSAACCTALRSANPSRHWGGSTNDGRSSHPCFAVHAVLLPVESANLSSSARMSCSSSWFSFGLKAGVACVTCCVDLLRGPRPRPVPGHVRSLSLQQLLQGQNLRPGGSPKHIHPGVLRSPSRTRF